MAYCVPGTPDFCGNPLQTLNHFRFDGAEIAKLGGAPYKKNIHGGWRKKALVKSVGFANAPFEKIALHSALEMALGDTDNQAVRLFAFGNLLPAETKMCSRTPMTAIHQGGDPQFPTEFL